MAAPTLSFDPRRVSHDQLFKELFTAFFQELIELFFPEAARELSFAGVEFLDKELATDRPQGAPRRLDLLAKVKTLAGQTRFILIHTEIQEEEDRDEGGSVLPFPQRMARYFLTLRLRHDAPIMPVVFWFAPDKGGVGRDVYEERLFGQAVLRFEYWRVGVRDLSAEDFLATNNPLAPALAARMKRGNLSKLELKRRCLLAAATGPALTDWQRYLLVNIIQTYVKLTPREQSEYEAMMQRPENHEAREVELTWGQQVFLDGERKGEQRGQVRMLAEAFSLRFGAALPAALEAALGAVEDPERLRAALGALLRAATQRDAEAQLTALCAH